MLRKTGKWAVLGFAGGLACVLSLFLAVSPASALLYPWAVTDPAGDAGLSERDILGASYIHFGMDHFFRIDLAAAPDTVNFPDKVGFWINSKPFQGASYPNSLVPFPLAGVDLIVSTDYSGTGGIPFLLNWEGSWQSKSDGGLMFAQTGNILEWKINDTYLNGPFDWWAATIMPGSSPATTYDMTAPITTPIPSAAWLLGSGVVALIGLRRRKVGRYSFS